MERIKKKLVRHEKKIKNHSDKCFKDKANIRKLTTNNGDKITKIENTVESIKNEIKEKIERPRIKVKKNEVKLQKSVSFRDDAGKTVLTDSTWEYVIFYLKQLKSENALFYWEQAFNFYKASLKLTNISKPLTTYYCFLNAVKALLFHRGLPFNPKHGVGGTRKETGQCKLQNEEMIVKVKGVLPSFSEYLNEPIIQSFRFNLKDALYNMAFIHRSFQLTFNNPSNFSELFIPIIDPKFVNDKKMKRGCFQFKLETEHSNITTLTKLKGFKKDKFFDNNKVYVMRRNGYFLWDAKNNKPTTASLDDFKKYYMNIRKRIRYIYSPNELWYLKRVDLKNKNSIINRHDLVLIFASMHRLSELSRYNPDILKKHLESNHSWLLNEFINKSILQFIDNIASEITGSDFRVTGFRA